MYTYVHGGAKIANSQKLEATQASVDERMDKQNVVHSHVPSAVFKMDNQPGPTV